MPDSGDWRRIRTLFEDAVDLEPAARAAFLAEREGDAAIRAEVESLLAADSRSARLSSAAASLAPGLFRDAAAPGSRLGSYRIVRVIASGGMGVVYEAEQENPRRTVALKTVRFDVASDDAARRFRYESEALARLRHPGIAQIYEAGVAAGPGGLSVPYFAMELVEGGRTILDYARGESLSPRERLELFVRVCDAVRHAHEKGVIHRDLKPGNVLIEAAGGPKIIDFGVARLARMEDESPTSRTRAGEIVGTLQYMSPEQFSGNPDDVDTLSDVYSLGVLLYELLCGRLPHDLSRKSITELARIVCEESPARPSTIVPELEGDVEWILLKALEREKGRRYATVADLALDVRRHLRDEPVAAGPPSPLYRLRKFVRRHRIAVGASALVAIAIVAGSIGTLVGLFRAREREKDATEALARAETEATKKTRINEFFRDMLRSVDPRNDGPEARVKDVVDRAAAGIEGSFAADPEIEGEIRGTIGNVYLGLGLFDEAEPHLRAAVAALEKEHGEGHRETLMAANNLATVFLSTERLAEAEASWRRLLVLSRRHLGDDDRMTIDVLSNLAVAIRNADRPSEAEPLYREALEKSERVLGESDPDTLTTCANLAGVLHELNRMEEAEAVARRALDGCRRLGGERVEALVAMNNLAAILNATGRVHESRPLLGEAVALARRTLGPTHPESLAVAANFLYALRYLKEYPEAESVAEELIRNTEAHFGPDHVESLSIRSLFASILRDQGKNERALEALGDVPVRARRSLGDAHPRTMEFRCILASILVELGRVAEAEAEFAAVLDAATAESGHETLLTSSIRVGYGDCLRRLKRFDESERELLSGRAGLAAAYGETHPVVLAATRRLVQLYEAAERGEDAAAWRERVPPQ